MIKNIAFDMGGVMFELRKWQAAARFVEIGVENAASLLDDFEQKGIFGDLESGQIDAERFRQELSRLAGRELSWEQCRYAWVGYAGETQRWTFEALTGLRERGYGLCLLSNTNPYMMSWTLSPEFDGMGHGIQYYFDAIYASYEMRVMKPDRRIFEMMLQGQHALPGETLFVDDSPRNCEAAAALGIHTVCSANGADWRAMVEDALAALAR